MNIETLKDNKVEELSILANKIWHECYRELLSFEQIEYMTNLFLSIDAIRKNVKDGYVYRIISVNNEMIGFTASIKDEEKIFLSKLYLLKDHRGNGYSKLMIEDVLNIHNLKTIYLTVNKYNKSYEIYKHLGFNTIDDVISDIGSGYVMDDYIMEKTF